MESKTQFTFLIVSDTHDNVQNVRKVVDWYNSNDKPHIDYIICAGDIATVPTGSQHLPEFVERVHPTITAILQELEKITPHIIYIPGNHDPYTLFQQQTAPKFTEHSVNLHKTYMKLADDLYIIGNGGSTPVLQGAKYQVRNTPFADLDFSKVMYNGYPYNHDGDSNYKLSDVDMETNIKEVITRVKEENANARMILLSHNGPLYTWTNVMVYDNEVLYLGSERIGELMFAENNLFLNIHGHCHTGRGSVNLTDDKTVVNPGALASGTFAMCVVKKNTSGVWELNETSLFVV